MSGVPFEGCFQCGELLLQSSFPEWLSYVQNVGNCYRKPRLDGEFWAKVLPPSDFTRLVSGTSTYLDTQAWNLRLSFFFSFIFISWRLITLQYTFLYQARLVSAVITSGSSLCGLQQPAFILFLHLCCCFMCLVTQLCLTVCNPMTVAHQAPLSIGILQATILE